MFKSCLCELYVVDHFFLFGLYRIIVIIVIILVRCYELFEKQLKIANI